MAKYAMYKMKILYIYKILFEESNENNRFTADSLVLRLKKLHINAERKSIYNDIEALRQFGVDIINQRGYYIASRDFELAELKILTDCISASHFITEKKSRSLIKKVEKLTDFNSARLLQRQVLLTDFLKTENEHIYYNVDILQKAIENKRDVSFKYFTYNIDKTKKYRNNGLCYKVSPYSLLCTDENYYLLAYYNKRESLTHFRIDRMTSLHTNKSKSRDIYDIMGRDFNLLDYSKKLFGMFSGETKDVKIQCDNSLVNVVIDKFGENVFMYPFDEKTFVFNINITISPTFFGWLFNFGTNMKILSPKEVADEYKNRLSAVLNKNYS